MGCKRVKDRHPAESDQFKFKGMDCYNKSPYSLSHCMGQCEPYKPCVPLTYRQVTIRIKCFKRK